jgi:hypothetical protein
VVNVATMHSMTPKQGLGPTKQHLLLLELAKLAQRPLGDADAAEKIMSGAHDLQHFPGLADAEELRLNKREAAQLTADVAAVLHISGWLVTSRQGNIEPEDDPFWGAINRYILFLYSVLGALEVGPDLLRAALKPPAAVKAPGGFRVPAATS